MSVSITKKFTTDILLSITALAPNTMARTRQDNVKLSLMDVPKMELIMQAHFKVRECALMMCMVLGSIFDNMITDTADDISHSTKVQMISLAAELIKMEWGVQLATIRADSQATIIATGMPEECRVSTW